MKGRSSVKSHSSYPLPSEYYCSQPAEQISKLAQNFIHSIDDLSDEEKAAPLCSLDDSTLIDLLSNIENIDKSLRASLSTELFDDVNHRGDLKKLWKDIFIFGHPDAEFLICLPPVVACSYRCGEYGIARRVQLELRSWIKEHGGRELNDTKLIFVYKRFVKKQTRMVCDNDNLEMRRITNAVINIIGGTDKANRIDFHYTTKIASFAGVELAVFRIDEDQAMLDYLLKTDPYQPDVPCFLR